MRYAVSIGTESVSSSQSAEEVQHIRGTRPKKQVNKRVVDGIMNRDLDFGTESDSSLGMKAKKTKNPRSQ